MTKITTQTVAADDDGIRLDRWFRRAYPSVTHGQLQKLLRTGQIRVAGKRAEASSRLQKGQEIRIPPQVENPPPQQVATIDDRLKKKLTELILFQDDDVLVLNKPAGLAVQGGTGLKENLDDMLRVLAGKDGQKPKLVHRLDRETSGVLLVARTNLAATRLTAAFRGRDARKIYWALTAGVPKPESGKIEIPLIKDGEKMRVADDAETDAKSAASLYEVIESVKGQAAFVALWPLTGRTHQLRVHMEAMGCPIWGDPIYGKDPVDGAIPVDELGSGLHLHARRIVIPHPRKGVIDVTAPLGKSMRKSWQWFGFDHADQTDFDR